MKQVILITHGSDNNQYQQDDQENGHFTIFPGIVLWCLFYDKLRIAVHVAVRTIS
jgi:hypothetical protein